MSQTIITLAFEKYKAQQEARLQPVDLNEFVLANVPDQDPTLAIDREEGLPKESDIVFVHAVTQKGYVNGNAVVYSLTMDTEVGDFDFNWIGLRNKASGVIAAISHLPSISKSKTIIGVQDGNTITRSIMMSYTNAKNITGIHVDASTWQIDFTARLSGIDENERLINVDHYGAASFLENGFKVFKEGSIYKASKGIAYVGGLRCELENNSILQNASKSTAVYLDASFQGQLTSKWETKFTIQCSKSVLSDHVDSAGFKHYVTKIADIDTKGNVLDTRFLGGTPSFERIDNAASNADIDETSTASKHVKLPQFWRGITNKISAAFRARTITTSGALQGGGNLSTNRTLSIKDASPTERGAVLLTNSVTSTSTELAPTAKALSQVNSLAASKMTQSTGDGRYAKKNGNSSEEFTAKKFNGNASSASKLSTARKIKITGGAKGEASFDGSKDVSIDVDLNSAAVGGADITYISKSQHNNLMMIINGELYTASGNNNSYWNSATGRGFTGSFSLRSMEFLTKVQFPDEVGEKISEVGGDGHNFNYALFDNGNLYTWGRNARGVCGVGHTNAIGFPVLVSTNVIKVFANGVGSYEASRRTSFIKKTDNYIYGCGSNANGELGFGDKVSIYVFTKITSLGTNIKRIWNFGGYGGYAFAESNDSSFPLKVAGWNGAGNLGVGDKTERLTWTEAPLWGTGEVENILGGGAYHDGSNDSSAGICTIVHLREYSGDGVVRSSGNNSQGNLGLGDKTQRSTPEVVYETTFSDFKIGKLSAVSFYYIDQFKNLYTWGDADEGHLGQGSRNDTYSPTLAQTYVSEVFSDGFDSNVQGYKVPLLYKRTNSLTFGCGRNDHGYLGIGTTNHSLDHVRVALDEELKLLGSFTTNSYGRVIVGITVTNRMYVWGYGGFVGINNSNDGNVLTPQLINLPDLG